MKKGGKLLLILLVSLVLIESISAVGTNICDSFVIDGSSATCNIITTKSITDTEVKSFLSAIDGTYNNVLINISQGAVVRLKNHFKLNSGNTVVSLKIQDATLFKKTGTGYANIWLNGDLVLENSNLTRAKTILAQDILINNSVVENLDSNIDAKGNLVVENSKIENDATYITDILVQGNLKTRNSKIKGLDGNLEISGGMEVINSEITGASNGRMMDNILVSQNMDLINSTIDSIKKIIISGDSKISNSQITRITSSFLNKFKIQGNLELVNSSIEGAPSDVLNTIQVGKKLVMKNSEIKYYVDFFGDGDAEIINSSFILGTSKTYGNDFVVLGELKMKNSHLIGTSKDHINNFDIKGNLIMEDDSSAEYLANQMHIGCSILLDSGSKIIIGQATDNFNVKGHASVYSPADIEIFSASTSTGFDFIQAGFNKIRTRALVTEYNKGADFIREVASLPAGCSPIVRVLPPSCLDADGDGAYVQNPESREACSQISDCDDANSLISPNIQEICSDGIDNNCNGLIDSDDPTGCGLIADMYWADMLGEPIDYADNKDWVQIILEGSFIEGRIINYSIIKNDESGKAVSGVLYNITSLDEARGMIKIPWKAEYNADEEPYYFKIELAGNVLDSRVESSFYEGLLEVGSGIDDAPTEVYILNPKAGEAYLIEDNVSFEGEIIDEDSIINQAVWDFGGVVKINSPEEVPSASSYVLKEENVSESIVEASYSTTGQKNVRITATNSETRETISDQVEILIADSSVSSKFVLAFISSPLENEYYFSQAGTVNGSAEGSYVLETNAGIITCLYGECPSSTSGVSPVPIANWDNAGALDSTDDLEFNWEIEGGLSWTKTGTQDEAVRFYKYFPVGENKINLILNYYESSVLQASSEATRTFFVAEFYDIVCDRDNALGPLWLYPNGTKEAAFSDCLIEDSSCCSSGYSCSLDNGDGTYSCELEISGSGGGDGGDTPTANGCARYSSEEECNADIYQEWENIVGEGQREDGLLCADGSNTKEINGTSYHLDCYCEWRESSCENVFSLIEDQNVVDDWPGSNGGLKPKLGSCSINKDTSGDDCSDGFLEYSWTGTYIWPDENSFDSKGECEIAAGAEKCIYDSNEGVWRYDPTGESLECSSGSNIVICPAKVQLSFFGFWNIVAGLALLLIIYTYFSFEKK